MGRLGPGDSWQQENGSFCSCRCERRALRCNTLRTGKQEQAQSGKASEPETHVPSWGQWVMVAEDSTFAEKTYYLRRFGACQGLRSEMLLSSPGTIDPCHLCGHPWPCQRYVSCVMTPLWSLGWRAWECRWCFLTFLLVQERMRPAGWQVQSGIKRNKALLNGVSYTGFLIHD